MERGEMERERGEMERERGEMVMEREEIGCIFICGCTGSGKSAVAIQLAHLLGGEVINGDALQLYKGLNIATAKVSESEMEGIHHHLLDVLEPTENANVKTFRQMATNVIKDIHLRSHCPILVGGTHYYIESVLFDHLESTSDETIHQPVTDNPHENLYELLRQRDPIAASTLHPNDTRRVYRALCLAQQLSGDSRSLPSVPVKCSSRYPRSLVIIVDCDISLLKDRLKQRVDGMVANGLLDEVTAFHQQYFSEDPSTTETKVDHEIALLDKEKLNQTEESVSGITVAIGYKELIPYIFERVKKEEKSREEISDTLKTVQDVCIEKIKVSTVQFARRQRTWIKNSLIPKCQKAHISVVRLNLYPPQSDSEESFCESVPTVGSVEELVKIFQQLQTNQFLRERGAEADQHTSEMKLTEDDRKSGETKGELNLKEEEGESDRERIWRKRKIFTCDVCPEQVFQGHDQYQIHLKSKKHRKKLSSRNKRLRDEEKEKFPLSQLEDEDYRERERARKEPGNEDGKTDLC